MIIITDCLTEKVDEGCLKVANSLAKRLKKNNPKTVLISYGRQSEDTDVYLKLNKLFFNKSLFDEIRKSEGNILYIPFASNTLASILRSCVLSIFSKRKVYVLFALRHSMNKISEFLLRCGKFQIITLSKKSFGFYEKRAAGRVFYLKTGVDTQKFCPVDIETKKALKQKYGLDEEKPVVLHVGHLHDGRNIEVLSGIREDKQVILVVSSETEQDGMLRKCLEEKKNIRIIDQYLPDIQEIYQLADVYVFPVVKEENSIDVPLSVLEAAACNIPIVTTPYGELKEWLGQNSIRFVEKVSADNITIVLDEAMRLSEADNRVIAERYDWKQSADIIEAWIK